MANSVNSQQRNKSDRDEQLPFKNSRKSMNGIGSRHACLPSSSSLAGPFFCSSSSSSSCCSSSSWSSSCTAHVSDVYKEKRHVLAFPRRRRRRRRRRSVLKCFQGDHHPVFLNLDLSLLAARYFRASTSADRLSQFSLV